MTQTCPIVGAFYRPPAKALLDHMPVGAKLILRAEPENPYDSNAIAVWFPQETMILISKPALDEVLAGYGTTCHDLALVDETHLGYIPKEMAANLKSSGFPEGVDITAEFSVGSNDGPRVRFEQ